jgi:U3 small nucleolar RNA-associated protein MPP10
MKDFEDL